MKTPSNLVLHPVRMSIVQTLLGGKQLTVQEMKTQLKEVPQATLYRHLNKLLDNGIITVIAQRQIRGAQEKIFALAETASAFENTSEEEISKETQKNRFMQFTSHLIQRFNAYLSEAQEELSEKRAFSTWEVYLSEDELQEVMAAIHEAVNKVGANEPSLDRQKYSLASIVIPYPDNKRGKN